MTDGNTDAINKHLDDQEDFDALQEIYAELEQAEAKIVELEDILSLRTNLPGEATYLIHKLEAKLAAKEKLVLALAGDKIDLVSELSGVKGELAKAVGALEKLARLGNGDHYGNSDGNMIAIRALAPPKGRDDE